MRPNTSFLSSNELQDIGFKSLGENVNISRHAQFYQPENMHIGSNVRIDDFCILSGHITLKNTIHISAYCALYGAYGITVMDNAGMSARTTIFSASDDFSGEYLIGPLVDSALTNVQGGKVVLSEFTQIGAHCVVLPCCTISTGTVIGANSLVTDSTDEWSIYAGSPAKKINIRSKNLLHLRPNSSAQEISDYG